MQKASRCMPVTSFIPSLRKLCSALADFSWRRASCKVAGQQADTEATMAAMQGTHFKDSFQAPNTWMEALYLFAEALR